MDINNNNNNDELSRYEYLVVDSGPIIRRSGDGWRRARGLVTVPAVQQEIRDAAARQYWQDTPIQVRSASREGIQAMTAFARLTGDYPSLSAVDLQVLGLLWDLEREVCGGDLSHLRTTPKRRIGLGQMETLGPSTPRAVVMEPKDYIVEEEETKVPCDEKVVKNAADEQENESDPRMTNEDATNHAVDLSGMNEIPSAAAPRAVWATNDVAAAPFVNHISPEESSSDEDSSEDGGQFSDASDDELEDFPMLKDTQTSNSNSERRNERCELESDFPSLALMPCDDSANAAPDEEQLEERKRQSLRPISKSGKLYNSFTKYQHLMKPANEARPRVVLSDSTPSDATTTNVTNEAVETRNPLASRIMGGTSGQGDDVDDDGEGWITNTRDISSMKAAGVLDPSRQMRKGAGATSDPPPGPLRRAACVTTDFAMQNVILQMNLELVSVDGMKVRKLKNWVTRCGACYMVYTSSDRPTGPLAKRLFCEKCGSDLMQRIAASVDGKTGRLRLHLSKNYQHNLRGTKFSLPKPGSGNRFQGDLLLREDQLLMGAWNQKVKMISGGKSRDSAQSIFGRDIASNVGCHAKAVSVDDIRVGFGRRNPNAAKGRERRGKKKKTTDKACGLRRY